MRATLNLHERMRLIFSRLFVWLCVAAACVYTTYTVCMPRCHHHHAGRYGVARRRYWACHCRSLRGSVSSHLNQEGTLRCRGRVRGRGPPNVCLLCDAAEQIGPVLDRACRCLLLLSFDLSRGGYAACLPACLPACLCLSICCA
jgi:hypothetical protein